MRFKAGANLQVESGAFAGCNIKEAYLPLHTSMSQKEFGSARIYWLLQTNERPDLITTEEMQAYGYRDIRMLPLGAERAKQLYKRCRIYKLMKNDIELSVTKSADLYNHDGLYGVYTDEWVTYLHNKEENDKRAEAYFEKRFQDAMPPLDKYLESDLGVDLPAELQIDSTPLAAERAAIPQAEENKEESKLEKRMKDPDYFEKKRNERFEKTRVNIPQEMRAMPHWCVTRLMYDRETGKTSKRIISAVTGRYAKVNDPSTWTTFEKAMAWAMDPNNKADGLTFCLTDSGISVIDLDGCLIRDSEGKWQRSEFMKTVMSLGRNIVVAERGTHEALMAKGGIYAALVAEE